MLNRRPQALPRHFVNVPEAGVIGVPSSADQGFILKGGLFGEDEKPSGLSVLAEDGHHLLISLLANLVEPVSHHHDGWLVSQLQICEEIDHPSRLPNICRSNEAQVIGQQPQPLLPYRLIDRSIFEIRPENPESLFTVSFEPLPDRFTASDGVLNEHGVVKAVSVLN